jgi:uncharacterized protein YkwD
MSALTKRIIVYTAVLALGVGTFYVARDPIVQYTGNVITFVREYSDAHDGMLQAVRQEIFSGPLKANIAGDRANLSAVEIIRLSNLERDTLHKAPLVRNAKLDQAATQKLQDMFDRQYFDHISPDGKGPGFLADQVGYSYVVVGENLAMGSFETDKDLVEAWMESPGHRENILSNRYTEIGVAVGHGTFNGERIWIAVQEFGKPTSACPAIDNTLRVQVEKDKAQVSAMSADIAARKQALASMPHNTPAESAAYNAKVEEYNTAVTKYNTLLTELRAEIDQYNTMVRNFNECAQD